MGLETSRILLRQFRGDDFEAVRAFRADPAVMRWFTGSPESDEDIRGFLSRTGDYALEVPRIRYRFAVVLRDGDRVIGGSGLDITDAKLDEAEIGYHLHADHWGQGIGTEAARLLLRFGFEELGIHRIWADCFAENVGSARVMEKAGMRREGHFRENRRLEGAWHDTLVYAILREEWNEVRLYDS